MHPRGINRINTTEPNLLRFLWGPRGLLFNFFLALFFSLLFDRSLPRIQILFLKLGLKNASPGALLVRIPFVLLLPPVTISPPSATPRCILNSKLEAMILELQGRRTEDLSGYGADHFFPLL